MHSVFLFVLATTLSSRFINLVIPVPGSHSWANEAFGEFISVSYFSNELATYGKGLRSVQVMGISEEKQNKKKQWQSISTVGRMGL